MSEILFFPSHYKRERSSIYVLLRYEGVKYKIPVGESVTTKFWNTKKHRAKETSAYPDCWRLNARLDQIEGSCRKVMTDIALKKDIPTLREVASLIRAEIKPHGHIHKQGTEVVAYFDTYVEENNLAYNTRRRYKTVKNLLERYESDRGKLLHFDSLNMIVYNDLRKWMGNAGYNDNYFGQVTKDLKSLHAYTRENGLHRHDMPEKFRVIKEPTDSIYLTTDELNKLAGLEITDELILENVDPSVLNVEGNLGRMRQSLIDCRDRFLIGCYTAMRYSDYVFLKGVRWDDKYISRVSEKTGIKTVIPMHYHLSEILKRRGNILPLSVSNQKFNDRLKDLCKIAGLKDKIEVTRSVNGVKIREVKEKWELVTTHTARRSGCTNMVLAGIDIPSIMKFSGHKTLQAFQKYIRVSEIEAAQKHADHPFFTR